jgi:pimeloyl-ACP methyl ester carboxylesterase
MPARMALPAAAAGALALAASAVLAQAADPATRADAKPQIQGDIAMTTRSSTLKVRGAELYYEVQGSGPMLLVIPGGPQDAGVFAELSQKLADRYSVVAYDPRGNSRTVTDAPPGELDVGQQADDAAALIDALGGGDAYVFGTSGGAQIGLDLAARHPAKVRALVAHEPPAIMLLDDPSEMLAADKDIYDTYKSDGVDATMAKFFGMSGLEAGAEHGDAPQGETANSDGPPEFDMPPEAAETFARVSGNFEYWLAHGMLPLSVYKPDIATLKVGRPRIVVAIGAESAGQPIEQMALALAAKLGTRPATFPGDHMGFEPHAEAFADRLHESFAGE